MQFPVQSAPSFLNWASLQLRVVRRGESSDREGGSYWAKAKFIAWKRALLSVPLRGELQVHGHEQAVQHISRSQRLTEQHTVPFSPSPIPSTPHSEGRADVPSVGGRSGLHT